MEEYVQEALQQGYLRPATSHQLVSFLMIKKGSNYQGLNQCVVKYRHPSVPAALEQLRNAQFSTYMKEMNGRQPSVPHLATVRAVLCHMGSLAPPLFSSVSSVMSYEIT